MCCSPTLRWLIVLTLPPRYRCPLNRLPASRLLLPRSGLERSDFVLWPECEVQSGVALVCLAGKIRTSSCSHPTDANGPERSICLLTAPQDRWTLYRHGQK